jgi:hypothetical protein
MDAELRDRAPQPKDNHTIHSYLTELPNAEENIREAVLAHDRRLANELRNPYVRSRGFQSWNQMQARPYVPTTEHRPPVMEVGGYKPPAPAWQSPTSPTISQNAQRMFPRYIPQAFNKTDPSGKGAGDKPSSEMEPYRPRQYEPARNADIVRNRPGPAWNLGVLAPR